VLSTLDSYISRWSKRFETKRLAGLFARYAGRQRYKVSDSLEARVLAWTTKRQPADGSTHWSTRKLAAELGAEISHMTIARIWAQHGLKPHRLEGYIASNDPHPDISSGIGLCPRLRDFQTTWAAPLSIATRIQLAPSAC
jgi:hypothetical protein